MTMEPLINAPFPSCFVPARTDRDRVRVEQIESDMVMQRVNVKSRTLRSVSKEKNSGRFDRANSA